MPSAGQVVRASHVVALGCRVTRTVAQAIPHITETAVLFDAETFDTDGMHSTVTNNTRITIATAGAYAVGFQGEFESQNYIRTFCTLKMNGTTEIARAQWPSQGASIPQRINTSTVHLFSVGDYIEALVFQENSVAATRSLVLSGARSPIFYAMRFGPEA